MASSSRVLLLIGCVVLAEPLASTILFPFVYFMVKDFGYATDEEIGPRAGIITSAFFFAQMCTTSIWGWASDKYGRRHILMVGLLGGAASMTLFGLSKSLLAAALSRALCGLLNGNVGVARTVVGEYAEQANLKQSRAFSVFGFCGALGYIVGPLIGGALADPASSLGWSGPGAIFEQYPYLLPCLVVSVFNTAVCGMTYAFLPETNSRFHKSEVPVTSFQSQVDVQETTPLLRSESSSSGSSGVASSTSVSAASSSVSSASSAEQQTSPKTQTAEEEQKPALTKASLACVLATGFIAFHAIIFDEGYALFTASSLSKGTGLSFKSPEIAISLSLMGIVIFITQLILYPWLNTRVGTLQIWRISAVVFAADYPLFSLLPLIDSKTWRWTVLLLLLTIRFAMVVLGYTSLNILINHVVEPQRRGLVNGFVQSMASLSRAVGPTLGGTLWSWTLGNGLPVPLDFHLFFFVLSVIAVAQGLISWGIPSSASSRS